MAAQVKGVLHAAAADLVEVDSGGNPPLIPMLTPASIDDGVNMKIHRI